MFSQIPQDNLYKFMAISGLASLLALIFYWYQAGSDRVISVIDYAQEVKEVGIDLNYLDQELDYYRSIEKDDKKAKWHYIQTMKAIDKSQALLKTSQDKLEYADGKAEAEGYIMVFLGVLSLILMCSGFSLWYWRLQRYLDASASESVKAIPNRQMTKSKR